MFSGVRASLRVLPCPTRPKVFAFSSTACVHVTPQPKPSLPLDPSLKSLLHDVDISLMSKGTRAEAPASASARELEALGNDAGEIEYYDMDQEDYPTEEPARRREDRKSPAARFGSHRIGTVVLSLELQRAITALIEGTNKILLHSDAKRLFAAQDDSGENWTTAYSVEYKTRRQRYEHSARDGTAFASVILPAHYAAIYAVLYHVKHRLGTSWNVERVIDWGSATGSGLWAALSVFQKPPANPGEGVLLVNSTIIEYIGLDQREGLVSIAKQLLQKAELGSLRATWRKSFPEECRVDPTDGHSTVALSAFMLSARPSPLSRKNMVKEMWDSGAQTIVLIDHNSPAGFQNIAEARQLLLDLGRKEVENPQTTKQPLWGSHVVAPCPHDRPCPLQHSGSSSLACGFSQRLQRPMFVRRTKHAKQGHEDIGYSYVVIRRGPRPDSTSLATAGGPVGRVGGVEREAIEREKAGAGVLRELQRAHEHAHDRTSMDPQSPPFSVNAGSVLAHVPSPPPTDVNSVPADQVKTQAHVPVDDSVTADDVEMLGRMASTDAASFMFPRVGVRSPDGATVRAQEQVPLSSTPTSTPSAPAQNLIPPFGSSVWTGRSGAEAGPDDALEKPKSPSNLEEALRSEAYEWPRLVFPPLKKSGHIIIDACTREGNIMRLTIPKSQGKQAFYDARKSLWGDMFPHPPKNKPIERFQPPEEITSKLKSVQGVKGSDVGKRSKGRDKKDRAHGRSYAALDDALWREQKARRKASRKHLDLEKEALDSESDSFRDY